MNTPPAVSFIVIGLNEAETLGECLRSIVDCDYPSERMEIIYVDSGSTDGSLKIARAFDCVRVIELDDDNPNAAKGRNAGWRVAEGDLIHFVDGDCVLEADWLKAAVTALADPEVAVVFGRIDENSPTFWGQIMGADWSRPPGEVKYCGGIALTRNSLRDSIGFFPEEISGGEEPVWCARIRHAGGGAGAGAKILSLDQKMASHDLGEMGPASFWRRAVSCGQAFAYVGLSPQRFAFGLWRARALRVLLEPLVYIATLTTFIFFFGPTGLPIWALALLLLITRRYMNLRLSGKNIAGACAKALLDYGVKIPLFIGALKGLSRRLTKKAYTEPFNREKPA